MSKGSRKTSPTYTQVELGKSTITGGEPLTLTNGLLGSPTEGHGSDFTHTGVLDGFKFIFVLDPHRSLPQHDK